MRLGLGLRVGGGFVGEGESYDPDVQTYITNVEAADGQALETLVKDAYNDFVVGCKTDGNRNALKACCILAGARTLAGALVPLFGSAPTSFNFVAADYDRKTGLLGNGTTKHLNSNRNNNTDPTDNKHLAVFVNNLSSGGLNFYAGARSSNASNAGCSALRADAISTFLNSGHSYTGGSNSAGFRGSSRSASSSYTYRVGSINNTAAINSETPADREIAIFAFMENSNSNAMYRTNARLSFYSIGEAVNLALLDMRVTALINALGALP